MRLGRIFACKRILSSRRDPLGLHRMLQIVISSWLVRILTSQIPRQISRLETPRPSQVASVEVSNNLSLKCLLEEMVLTRWLVALLSLIISSSASLSRGSVSISASCGGSLPTVSEIGGPAEVYSFGGLCGRSGDISFSRLSRFNGNVSAVFCSTARTGSTFAAGTGVPTTWNRGYDGSRSDRYVMHSGG